MKVISSIQEWQAIRKSISPQRNIGFVPTMGNLHQGHASLLNNARNENDVCVLSIFINPTQFNDKNDFEKYPKTFEDDVKLASDCHVDFIFSPQANDIYHDNYLYQVCESNISKLLEGKQRPGHFDGVLTVVMKLFNLVKPHRAYFGEKDYQQLLLIKGMVDAFFLDIDIVACPTVRLSSGLALSSRNNRLNEAQIDKSKLISQLLTSGLQHHEIRRQLETQGFEVEYVQEWQKRLFAAVKIGDVRLIDNVKIPDLIADIADKDL